MRRLLALAALVLAPASSAAPIYIDLGRGHATGVSADGSVVVGWDDQDGAFRWTQAGGRVSLAPGSYSEAYGVSADGSVIVGYPNFRWTEAGGMVSLGTLPGTAHAIPRSVSADGLVVVGGTYSETWSEIEAFRWTEAGGMVGLGDLPGGPFRSGANGVSGDGSVIVGGGTTIRDPNDPSSSLYFQAFRWTQADGMIGLGSLPGGSLYSTANAISADGNVVVGISSGASGYEAFRWTELDGMVGLGNVGAVAVSADGSVVVGGSSIWDAANGTRHLPLPEEPCCNYGVFDEATGVSADGTTIVGNRTVVFSPFGTSYTTAWVLIIPEPGTGLLLMTGVLGLAASRRRRAN